MVDIFDLKGRTEKSAIQTVEHFAKAVTELLDAHYARSKSAQVVLPSQRKMSTCIFYQSAAGKWYRTNHTLATSPDGQDLIISFDSFEQIPEPRSLSDSHTPT
jgi:hypothetical protein